MMYWALFLVILALPLFAQPTSVAGVVNAASFQQGQAVAGGSLVSIFGTSLASSLAIADSIPLSTSMNGVSVTFNDIPAPLLFVAPGQINAQLPWNVSAGQATVVVTTGGSAAPGATFQVGPSAPGIFAVQFGVGQAIAINNADSTLAAPVESIPGLTTHPAKAGDAIIIYATGLGPVDSPVDSGQIPGTLTRTLTVPTVLVGGAQAQVLFSGLTPQFVGVNQVNIVVPSNAPTGDKVPLQIQLNGITTTDQVTMAIQ